MSVQDHFTLSEPEILDVTESQAEDHTIEESTNPIYHNSEESGYEDFPSDIQINTTAPHQTTTKYNADSEKIPELEEDWDNGQFADAESTLITHHNTHSESKQIRWDYTQQFLDLTDNQYYEEETPVNQSQYSNPDPDYYGSATRRSQKPPHDPNGYYPPHLTQQTYSAGMHKVGGKELYYMGTDFLVRKPDLLKVEKPERDGKITDNE